jgi:tensin
MFRAAFHTGYVPSGVLRLTKAQLDGAGADPRFSDEFFLDLIFAPIEPNSAGAACPSTEGSDKPPSDSGIQVEGEFSERYEQTLHRDVRFWESIAARKNKAKRRRARKFVSTTHDQFSIGEDDKGGGASTEIVFSNSHSHSSSDSSPDDDGLAASNMDLIAALAEAEDFGDEDMGLGGGGGDGDGDDDGHTSETVPISASTSAPASIPAPTTPVAKEVNDNLAALDELEKELGIDGDSTFVAEQSSTPKGAAEAGVDTSIEEEFDELEKYLESLATPSK